MPLARGDTHGSEEECTPISRLSTKYATVNPPATIANVSTVCFSGVISPGPCSSSTGSSQSSCLSVAEPKWKTLSRQFLHGWTCNGYEKRTRTAIASCPTATKSEVAGYIAMMFALTCKIYYTPNGKVIYIYAELTRDPNVR